MQQEKKRIWELDAIRGLCILGMIVIHFLYDLSHFGEIQFSLPQVYYFIKEYGHILFVVISGICVTLASKSFRRGVMVFGAALLISYVTLFMDLVLNVSGVRIWFGILHMLGICMMIYPIVKKFPGWLLGCLGFGFIVMGVWFASMTVSADFLFPLGICSNNFYEGCDFFPLFPGFGWFLLGAFVGKTLYRSKKSILPTVNSDNCVLLFLQNCGKHSLSIYLAHQPILIFLILLARKILTFF